jgi:starvation-inducible outer membrane lipoprotein
MRHVAILVLALFSLVWCSIPVIRNDLLDQGIRDVSMTRLAENPQPCKGKVFILGGAIVSTRLTETGSLIEAVYIPADSAGYLNVLKRHACGGRKVPRLVPERAGSS